MSKKEINRIKRYKIESYIIIIITIIVSYKVFSSNISISKINEITSQYISYCNKKETDGLWIHNVKKLSSNKGKSKSNKASLTFTVEGKKNEEYELVIIPKNNTIEEKYINYMIQEKDIIKTSNLADTEINENKDRILYRNKINNNKLTVKLWISKEYKKEISDNLFEIKINKR